MREDKDLFEAFGDILRETPEAESPLRQWKQAQARRAVEERIRVKRAADLEDAYRALAELRRTGRPH